MTAAILSNPANLDEYRSQQRDSVAQEMAISGESDAAFGAQLKYTHPVYVQAYVKELNRRIAANEIRTGNQGEILWGEAAIAKSFAFGCADEPF